jgi:uncharacterized SAM-binding protein YcdF (DUF218 family)
MEFAFLKHLELLVQPPGISLILGVAGLFLMRRRTHVGLGLLIGSFSVLYLFSMPVFAAMLHSWLSKYPSLTETTLKHQSADAIVVLAGGRLYEQNEYGEDSVSGSTLQRLRYAAWIKRRTNLPLYVSGGQIKGDKRPEAALMQAVLQKEFDVAVDYVEGHSKSTYENAQNSAQLLKSAGHHIIFLVTHDAHMRRSVAMFEHFGVKVIPAPTASLASSKARFGLLRFMPDASAMARSKAALHEYLGLAWFALRY